MILRDPVHGLVAFERPEEQLLESLVDAREFQRLRRVRMLGVTSLAFPGAEHSRFVHGVGAAHVMRRFLDRMRILAHDIPSAQRMNADDESLALAAALLHDLGHGPLSHLFEEVFDGSPPHETWTSRLLLDPESDVHRVLHARDVALPQLVERLIHGEHRLPYLAHAVSGTFDVDRCDYLLRDSYMTGVRYGLYDLEWLLRSLRLSANASGSVRLAVDGAKGLPAVEGFFLARLFMYQQVYFHKTARAAEVMMRSLFARSADLARDGRVSDLPPVLAAMARREPISTRDYLSLDDETIWSTVERWESSNDSILSDLASRLRRRTLFKTASLEDDDALTSHEYLGNLREIVKQAGFDPRYYAVLDVAEVAPYSEPNEPEDTLDVVYHHGSPRALSRASFLIGKLQGEKLSHRRLVFPQEVRDKVTAMLDRARAS